jgi:glycosyltransferase involved in cell wall biosynthesis
MSIQSQKYSNWIAIVFDDSPEQEGNQVVKEFQDNRIIYRPNSINLGASANLNQCFQSTAIMGGQYACILEDDNWLLPDYISSNINALETTKVSIIHRNQEVWIRDYEPPKPTRQTTLKHRFYKEGIIEPCELHAGIFFFTGISNGALFWNTETIQSKLEIPDYIDDPSLQEYCRCLQIIEPSLVDFTCHAVYSHISPYKTSRKRTYNREFGRALQHIRRQAISYHGKTIIDKAIEIANVFMEHETLEKNLLNSLFFRYDYKFLTKKQFFKRLITGIAKYYLVSNPLSQYCFYTSE